MNTRRAALTLAIAAWCGVALGAIVSGVGPLSLPSVGLSISSAARPWAVAAVCLALALVLRGPRVLFDELAVTTAPYVATIALVLTLATGVLVTQGAVSVGGADSAGYLAQARRWRSGHVREPLPLHIAGLETAPSLQSPLGFRPDPTGTATVPTYPPGLPWLQALALSLGEPAAIRGVPLLACLVALLAAHAVARTMASPPAAALVVIWLASMPPFLFQALQPMSDIPALAAWMLALALAAHVGTFSLATSAIATATAVLIRPNLAPLAAAVAWQAADAPGRPTRRLARATTVSLAAVVAVAVVAGVQTWLYGSAAQSGYGRASELFAFGYVPVNVCLYAAWFAEAIAWPALAVLAAGAVWLLADARQSPAVRPVGLIAVLTLALYLVYVPFDSWTYLRFVLPATAVALLGAARLVDRMWRQHPTAAWRFPAFCALALLVAIPNLRRADALAAFDVRARESRYETAGAFVRTRLPADTVVIAGQHSAAAAYYSGRPVLRADLLDPASLAVVEAWAAREQRNLALVLDVAEADAWRARFGPDAMALDWPPRAEIGRPIATRVWLAADRAAYRIGAPIPTARLIAAPR